MAERGVSVQHAGPVSIGSTACRRPRWARAAAGVRRPWALAEPLTIVASLDLERGAARLLDRVEGPHPQQVLPERPDEALGDAIARGFPYDGRARRDPQERQGVLETAAHALTAVIVPDLQPRGNPLLVAPGDRTDALL
jgi:hypothetical protein